MHAVQWPPGGTLLIGTVRARSGEPNQGKACFSTWGVTTETLVWCQCSLTQHYKRLIITCLAGMILRNPLFATESSPQNWCKQWAMKDSAAISPVFFKLPFVPITYTEYCNTVCLLFIWHSKPTLPRHLAGFGNRVARKSAMKVCGVAKIQ